MLHKNNIPEIGRLLDEDPRRTRDFTLAAGGWLLDYSRLPLTRQDREGLYRKAASGHLDSRIRALFSGQPVNRSENRPALHMALRARDPSGLLPAGAAADVADTRARMLELAASLHSGKAGLTDLVHVGIGGSELGPRLVARALECGDSRVNVHWVSALDRSGLERLIGRLDPGRTGIILASKSFATGETLLQARVLRDWMRKDWRAHTWAVTARSDRAREFGLDQDRILEFPDWVGGRFSLWSAIGVSAAAAIGPGRFQELLAGAEEADGAFAERRGEAGGLAILLATLLDFLRRQAGHPALGVISYEPRLEGMAAYVQQLIMESLGKCVDEDGAAVEAPTAPLVFGGAGPELQHSLFQAAHQGTDPLPMLLAGVAAPVDPGDAWHQVRLAHLLAQAQALARGRHDTDPARALPGNRPVLVLLADRLDPGRLGYLLATLEHAVYVLGCFWRINPFDQWGVEEGKRLAGHYQAALRGEGEPPDAAAANLLRYILERGDS